MSKKIFISILLLVSFYGSISSQISKTDYFLKNSYSRTFFNPAFRPTQGSLLLPFLPNIGASLETNTLNLEHLTFNRNNERVTFLHPSVSNNDFLGKLKDNNYVQANVDYRIFGLNFYKGSNYFMFDIAFKTRANVNIPKSVFSLLKEGFEANKYKEYNLKDINAYAQSFVEIGFGNSRVFLDNNLAIGARAKFLLGAAHVDLKSDKLSVGAGMNEWVASSKVSLKMAAPGIKPKYDEDGFIDGFDTKYQGIPGWGLGLDIGASYDLGHKIPVLKGLIVSAAINDIGFINWSKSNSVQLSSSGETVTINPSYWGNQDGTSIDKVLEDAFNDLKDAVNLQERPGDTNKSYSTSLQMSMNMGVQYGILNEKITFGLLYNNLLGKYYTTNELTTSVSYQPNDWFGAAVSYSMLNNNFDNFGLAVHLTPNKGITFFASSDYLLPKVNSNFYPTSSKAINVQVGFSIPLGKKKAYVKKQESINMDDIPVLHPEQIERIEKKERFEQMSTDENI